MRCPGRRTAWNGRPAALLGAAWLALAGCGRDEAPPPAQAPPPAAAPAEGPAKRLHWFIPDGMRADPEVFDVFRWAREGRLPHIAEMMERGAYGYSIPAFPSHTPSNFATLLTGALPRAHGVADGPMHVEGQTLDRPSVAGFASAARKLPAVWTLLEKAGLGAYLLSVPGSTPPELAPGGTTVRGRWGGWGADFPSLVFERESKERRAELARSARLFFLGEALTRFVAATGTAGWTAPTSGRAPRYAFELAAYGQTLHALAVDGTPGGGDAPDRVLFSRDRAAVLADLAPGEWSGWFPVTLDWRGNPVATQARLHLIRLPADGAFRVRLQIDALNRLNAEPSAASDVLHAGAGPMVDFADNYPAQLVWHDEDKRAFLDEVRDSLAWHARAVDAVAKQRPGVFVHDTYTPNQMLTSRWWMGSLDPKSARYGAVPEAEREALWSEVMEMYRGLDEVVGRALAHADPDTLVVLSSDHGAVPLDRGVRLNNLFATRGWLKTRTDPDTLAPVIDWAGSRVVYLNMAHVYVHPDGLAGPWRRGSGPAYEALRAEVAQALVSLRDGDVSPAASVTRWERVEEVLDLPRDRVGDLVLANRAGYAWTEDLTADREVFVTPRVTGYKQGVPPDSTPALWTPFVVVGPGIRAGHRLGAPIRAIDQLPTLLRAMGQPVPAHVEGRAVPGIFTDEAAE